MQTAYTSYFGFSDKPFKFKPDPRFFYHNPNYDNAYDAVVKGLRERKSWVVLTGESGTGKTTLVHKCRTAVPANFRITPVPNTLPNINSFLSHIGKSLDLDISDDISNADHTRAIAQIRAFLVSQAQQGQATALLIEDAQNLADSVLAGMLDLNKAPGAQESRLQIIMLGSPELGKKLRRFNFPAEDSIYYNLAPLQDAEVKAFIQHQIQTANYQDDELFSPEAIEHIASYAKGIPRLINTLCDSALLIASRQNQKIITKTIIEEAARRCFLTVDKNIDKSIDKNIDKNIDKHIDKNKTPHSTVSKRPLQQRRESSVDKKPSPGIPQNPTPPSGVTMNRRWLWASMAATTTLILVGGIMLFYQYESVTPSLAVLSTKAATPAIQSANITSITTIPGKGTVSPVVPIQAAHSRKANVVSVALANTTTATPTAREMPNKRIESTRTTSAESTHTPHNSRPQNNDLPHQTFTVFEEVSSTASFQPQSSSVFVEMRGPNNEIFDGAGRVKSVITRKDTDL